MAHARRRGNERPGLEFPRRPFPLLRARRPRWRRRAPLHRPQRRRRRCGTDVSGMAGCRPLGVRARYRQRRDRRQRAAGRRCLEGQAALGAGVRGLAMSAFGPALRGDGVTFRLWAPAARDVHLVVDRPTRMEKRGEWFEAHLAGARAGLLYRFNIDGELDIPDPASHFQPHDVHGQSEVVDHAYDWQCRDWAGLPWERAVFSEVHVGTFTREGTFRAVADRLDHLAATGITALELMPLADFPGRWNWGYDGVLPFAPDSSYGRPEDLKALIDAAHARGLMVFLDVVYNHFGPAGRYRAQWNDDYHHGWHVLLTGEDAGYYRDYARPAAQVVRTLREGYAYQGEPSPNRGGEPRGEPSGHLPPGAFVDFIQNHDQIGNRPKGERLTALARPEPLAAALAVLLLQPSPPLLFMGEEWGATEPFPF